MNRRGSVLIFALLMLLLIFTMAGGFLLKRADQYKGSQYMAQALRAEGLAQAGLEDARVKLDRDLTFPPPGAVDQLVFTYEEPVMSLDSSTQVGNYRVTIDRRWAEPPFRLVRITSVGTVGDEFNPVARRELTAELHLPTFRYVHWLDSGAP